MLSVDELWQEQTVVWVSTGMAKGWKKQRRCGGLALRIVGWSYGDADWEGRVSGLDIEVERQQGGEERVWRSCWGR